MTQFKNPTANTTIQEYKNTLHYIRLMKTYLNKVPLMGEQEATELLQCLQYIKAAEQNTVNTIAAMEKMELAEKEHLGEITEKLH